MVRGGGTDLLADEDIAEGLVVVEESTIGIDEEEVVVEFFGNCGGVLDFGEDVLEEGSFFGIGENATILEQVNH